MRHLASLAVTAALAVACSPPPTAAVPAVAVGPRVAEPPLAGPAGAPGGEEPSAPPPDPGAAAKRRDDAILLETLVLGWPRTSFSGAAVLQGLTFMATGLPYVGGSAVYIARGGPVAYTVAPSVVGLASFGVGGYYFLSGGDLLAMQVAMALDLRTNPAHEWILNRYEPRLSALAARARARRKTFGATLIGLSILTAAAATYTALEPIPRLDGGVLPSVLYGISAIDAVGALTFLTYESPAETAWDSYVRNSTWK